MLTRAQIGPRFWRNLSCISKSWETFKEEMFIISIPATFLRPLWYQSLFQSNCHQYHRLRRQYLEVLLSMDDTVITTYHSKDPYRNLPRFRICHTHFRCYRKRKLDTWQPVRVTPYQWTMSSGRNRNLEWKCIRDKKYVEDDTGEYLFKDRVHDMKVFGL